MAEFERAPLDRSALERPSLADPAAFMRRAIRSVAAAQELVSESIAGCARRKLEAERRRVSGGAHASSDAAERVIHEPALRVQRAALHAAVGMFVFRLRDAGEPPEGALVRLKLAVRGTPTDELELAEREQLLDDVVTWGIEAYDRVARSGDTSAQPGDAQRAVAECLAVLDTCGVRALLQRLNARTRFRFTGVYRVEAPVLRNLALFDRENPSLSAGGDINALADTCCSIVVDTENGFSTGDVRSTLGADSRQARFSSVQSYQGVPIRDETGNVWGTLCHYDYRPRLLAEQELVVLEWLVGSVTPVEVWRP